MKFLFKYKWSPNLLCTQMHALKYKCENMICILSGSIKEINGILLYASIFIYHYTHLCITIQCCLCNNASLRGIINLSRSMTFVRLMVRLWSSWYVYGVTPSKHRYIYILVYLLYKDGSRRMVLVWY